MIDAEKKPIRFYVDGGCLGKNPSPRGVYWSVFVEAPGNRRVVVHKKQSPVHHTNNEAEWLAVQSALEYAERFYPQEHLLIYSDSRLIVKQFNREWRNKIARLHRLMSAVRQ